MCVQDSLGWVLLFPVDCDWLSGDALGGLQPVGRRRAGQVMGIVMLLLVVSAKGRSGCAGRGEEQEREEADR